MCVLQSIRCFTSLLSPRLDPGHDVNHTQTCCQTPLPSTLAGRLPSPLHGPSSLSPLPCLFPDRPTANVHQMPPLTPTPPNPAHRRSLSLLTPLFNTDRWNCYQYWLLSPCLCLCLPHSTLSILSSSFLSLTK